MLSGSKGGARAHVEGTRRVLVRGKNTVSAAAAALVVAAAALRSVVPNAWRPLHHDITPELLPSLHRALGARQGVAQQAPLGAAPLKPAALAAAAASPRPCPWRPWRRCLSRRRWRRCRWRRRRRRMC
jgi:hypothetical protein